MDTFGLTDVAWAFGSLLIVSIIGMLWTQRARIVSSVSRMQAEGEARRMYRQQLYGRAPVMVSQDVGAPVPAVVPGAVPVPGLGAPTIDLIFLAGNLTEAQYIELGARLRDRRDKFVFSGKKLYTLAGGNHDEFLVSMRRWRGDESPEDEPAYVTPIVGRPTAARFETDPEYPYQAPAH